ncbi:hypothetical protein Q5752_003346 [Cryptotrichosporon argae]
MPPHSASDDGAVIIDPLSPSPSTVLAPPRLQRPWPLLVLVALDAACQLFHALRHDTSPALVAAAVGRLTISGGTCGLSAHWRARSGWVASASGASVLTAVWVGCAGRLSRASEPPRDSPSFLLILMAVATLEYLLMVLLLRLSPASSRTSALSFRYGRNIQSPTSFRYTTIEEQVGHSRGTLQATSDDADADLDDAFPAGFDAEMGPESSDDIDSRSESSFSESSIIDMPLPSRPSRIIPPASLSMNALPILEEAPVLGPLIRRSRSMRLGSSLTSDTGDYGTF